jgi:tight adherence protein C
MEDLVARLFAGDLMYLTVLLTVFLGVLALFWGVRYLLASHINVVKDRLRRTVGSSTGGGGITTSSLTSAGGVEGTSLLQQALGVFSFLSRPASEEEMGRLRRRLVQGGLRSEAALVTYLGSKVLLCLILGGLVLWINSLRPQPLRFLALYTIVTMIIGFYLPNIWLHLRVKKRNGDINKTLPDALDLVVTCVEAGLGLDQSMERVASEVRISSTLLSQELAQASMEMRAGIARGEAFRRLAQRTGVEELHNLAAIIIQTDLFGTSVAKSLRVMAEAMRIRRTQRAEERAATVGVKLTIPLIFCILPSLFAVLMGPAAVRIIRILLPTLYQGG